MIFAINTNLKWGEPFKIKEFEDEEKLKTFLLNSHPNDKIILIRGEQIKYTTKTEIVLSSKVKED